MKIYNTIYRNKVPITNLACFEKVKTISLVWNHISGIAFYSESLTRKPPFFNAASFVVVSIFLDAAVLPSTVYSVHICRVVSCTQAIASFWIYIDIARSLSPHCAPSMNANFTTLKRFARPAIFSFSQWLFMDSGVIFYITVKKTWNKSNSNFLK